MQQVLEACLSGVKSDCAALNGHILGDGNVALDLQARYDHLFSANFPPVAV